MDEHRASIVPQQQPPPPHRGDMPMPPAARWEHFEHAADIGVRGFGASKSAAFEQAALALTAVVAPLDGIAQATRVDLACEAADDELLFVAWLNALIYEMAVRRMLFSRYIVAIDGAHLQASAWGEAISVPRHRPAVEVKGATFTALRVARCDDGGGWLAQTVVDV
ncbi:MAG: archease [Rubrivivax sp.]|nr:archease [Rubrivivax sp.]